MKTRKIAIVVGMAASLSMAVVSCGSKTPDYTGKEVQGVTATEILVGNTAATTGTFAAVGVPFNVGIESVFADYNAAGGFNGASVKLVHYDDGFDGATGLTFTKQLVEDDKVFALVGHFGTNTVTQTIDYIKEKGIPMVYAATGISALYQEEAKGYNRAVMSVQPIYNAEGRVLLARALASTDNNAGLGGTKVGVISTTDDAGVGMLAGVKRQAEELSKTAQKNITYVETSAEAGTDHSAAINVLKNAACDVVIVAANQTPFVEIMNYMRDNNFNTKVITSYVSANTTTLGGMVDSGAITKDRPAYTTAWLDITSNTSGFEYTAWYEYTAATKAFTASLLSDDTISALTRVAAYDLPGFECYLTATGTIYYKQVTKAYCEDYWDFYECMVRNGHPEYMANSYAMAGYIAAKLFVEGLTRVKDAKKDLTWKNYIDEMEDGKLNIAMGGTLDYSNGNRFGVVDLALNTISVEKNAQGAYTLLPVDGIQTLDDVWSKLPASSK